MEKTFRALGYNHQKLNTEAQDNFWWRELPEYTEADDPDGTYLATFTELLHTDVESEFDDILREYRAASSEKREIINRLFVHLCGYRLPSIVAIAHGFNPDEIE